MQARRKRAVAASDAAGLPQALDAAGYELAGRATDAASLLRLLREVQPDLAACDAILPGTDGAALARRIRAAKLNVQPAILLLVPRGLRLPGAGDLPGLGAAALSTPAGADALARALTAAGALPIPLPKDKAARLEALMDALGVPEHPGRACLRSAVALAWADRRRLGALRRDLYPAAAREAALSPEQCERAIRHVIDSAFRTGEIDQQHRIFGDTIDARRGKPTVGEMIAQLAEELRWEG